MKTILFLFFSALFMLSSCADDVQRSDLDFNDNWLFARGEMPGAEQLDYDDSQWQQIRLPHDWSVREGFSKQQSAGATAYLPGGIGWYRKAFTVPRSAKEKITWISFDGVYNNATVWLNGTLLGKRPYGYSAFNYDLTPHLNFGGENVIVVKADRSAYVDSRWYPGSGIYRKVRLVTSNKLHIPQWGTKISTPMVCPDRATVAITTAINNASDQALEAVLRTTLCSADGEALVSDDKVCVVAPQSSISVGQQLDLDQPQLWSCNTPYIYKAYSSLLIDGVEVDRYESFFGVRSIRYDANTGFYLNEKNTLLKGVNLHHDGGLVGAAVPDGVWRRRLALLKEAGCNAIRTAHNPPSTAFLNLCDEMGFLVQDEAFDEFNNPKSKRHNFNQEKAEAVTRGYTEHFDEWAERDLKTMVRRDYNHPCIIMWSLGNEIEWTYPRYGASTGYWGANKATPTTNYYWDEPPFSIEKMKALFDAQEAGEYNLATTAHRLSQWLKEEDTTRPVTANLVIPSVGHFSGYTDALDIVGYSYRQSVYDYGHKHYPDKMILGTENFPRWHEWKCVLDRPYIPGMFIWTGIGYLGEAGAWPHHGGGSGLLNLAGFKNPQYYQFKSFWTDEPVLYLTTQTLEKSPYQLVDGQVQEKVEAWWKHQKWGWQAVNEHWNYVDGQPLAIEAYTNCERVELFLNERSLGLRYLNDSEDRILKWSVPYEAGRLHAQGVLPNGDTIAYEVQTAHEPSAIRLTVDKSTLEADNYDVVHVVAEIVDEHGVVAKPAEMAKHIQFEVAGNARVLGVDNGADTNVEGFHKNTVMTYRGQCLMIIQANDEGGEVTVSASAEGLTSDVLVLKMTNKR